MSQSHIIEIFRRVNQFARIGDWDLLDQGLKNSLDYARSPNVEDQIKLVASARACYMYRSKLPCYETFIADAMIAMNDPKPLRGLLRSPIIHNPSIPMKVRKFIKADIDKLMSVQQFVLSIMAIPPAKSNVIPKIFSFEIMKAKRGGPSFMDDYWVIYPERSEDTEEMVKLDLCLQGNEINGD